MKTDSSVVSLTEMSLRLSPATPTISGSRPARPLVNTTSPVSALSTPVTPGRVRRLPRSPSALELWKCRLENPLRPYAALQVLGRATDENLAVIDDGHSPAELVGFFHVVGGQHDGNPTLSELANDVPQCQTRLRIEARARLVEETVLGIVGDSACDLHPLASPPDRVFTKVWISPSA